MDFRELVVVQIVVQRESVKRSLEEMSPHGTGPCHVEQVQFFLGATWNHWGVLHR